jgi:hypothetical protein
MARLDTVAMERFVYGEVLVRDYNGALAWFDTLEQAQDYAENVNPDVWRISFTDMLGNRHRFIKAVCDEFPGWYWKEQSIFGLDGTMELKGNA